MSGRPNRINIDLGVYKQPWLAYCAAHRVTPSQGMRQVVAHLTAEPASEPSPSATAAHGPRVRKQLTLSAGEFSHVSRCARRQGFRETAWIIALIRAHMLRAPQLGQTELELLGRSNLVLLGIGRNLNQIARALNSGIPVPGAELVPVLKALRIQLSAHVDTTAKVLSSNLSRWSLP